MSRLLLAAALALAAACTRPATRSAAPAPLPAGAVRHVVVFKYRPTARPEDVRRVTEAFAALRTQIPGILGYEHGVNDSPERLNQGFTHVHLVTFASAAARDAYLPHPAHKAFTELVGRLGVLDAAFVVDYAPGG